MKSFTAIVLAALAITQVACQLTIKDTIIEDDLQKYDSVMALATEGTYMGYFYSNATVSVKIHSAESHDIIAEETFKGNGKAVDYLLQNPDIKPEDVSEDGVMTSAAKCPKKRDSADAIFEKRASRCHQFCGRSRDCTGDRRCPLCVYVGGRCRWQLRCMRR